MCACACARVVARAAEADSAPPPTADPTRLKKARQKLTKKLRKQAIVDDGLALEEAIRQSEDEAAVSIVLECGSSKVVRAAGVCPGSRADGDLFRIAGRFIEGACCCRGACRR